MSDKEGGSVSLYHDLIQAHGETAQMRQLQEECGELTAAVSHYLRGRITRYQLACELADVHIMCKQAQIIVGPEICNAALERKLDRAKDKLRETAAARCHRVPGLPRREQATWYSQGPDGEFDLHASADDARAAAESMLEYYSDNAASGEWNADIEKLQWGKLVPHEVASVHGIPAPEGFPDGEYWDVTLVPYQPKKG